MNTPPTIPPTPQAPPRRKGPDRKYDWMALRLHKTIKVPLDDRHHLKVFHTIRSCARTQGLRVSLAVDGDDIVVTLRGEFPSP